MIQLANIEKEKRVHPHGRLYVKVVILLTYQVQLVIIVNTLFQNVVVVAEVMVVAEVETLIIIL